MMKLVLGGVAAAALVAIVPAVAQPAPPPPGVAQGTTPLTPAPPMRHRYMRVHRMDTTAQTRAQVASHVRDMFGKLDSNRDGFVTRAEANAVAGKVREKVAKRVDTRRGERFDDLDANHDGMLSRDEFAMSGHAPDAMHVGHPGMRAMKRMHQVGMRMHGRMFESADANRDGRVSLQEATNLALQHFDRADANHDGQLTPDERRQMHRGRMREHMRPA